jgi:hypothetical protein
VQNGRLLGCSKLTHKNPAAFQNLQNRVCPEEFRDSSIWRTVDAIWLSFRQHCARSRSPRTVLTDYFKLTDAVFAGLFSSIFSISDGGGVSLRPPCVTSSTGSSVILPRRNYGSKSGFLDLVKRGFLYPEKPSIQRHYKWHDLFAVNTHSPTMLSATIHGFRGSV